MDSISSSCATTPACWDSAAVSKSYNSMQFSRISASSKESKDITIYTEEGDKVTISYDQQTQASYDSLKALSYRGDFARSGNQTMAKEVLTSIQGERFQFEDSRSLSISVDGDLNDQELSDIKKALEEVDEIMTDLLQGGNISEAMADAAEIKDLESIAGLEADYRYEKTLQVEKVALEESETYSRYGTPQDISSPKHKNELDSFMKLIDKMAKIVEDSNAKPKKFSKHLNRLFANYAKDLEEDRPGNKAKRRAADLIGAELVKRIEQLADKDKSGGFPKMMRAFRHRS